MTAPALRRAVIAAQQPLAPSRKDRAAAALAAVAFHALVLAGGGAVFVESAEYGVQSGPSGIDVDLVAAPPAAEPAASVLPPAPAVPEEAPADPETAVIQPDAVAPPVETPPAQTPVPAAPTAAASSGPVGDGSSPVPGKDATTFHSRAGALNSTPSYLKNPPPRYPEAARAAGQEGVVLLRVEISAAGKAEEVKLMKSSGFAVLDDAAMKAVSKWRFRSAKAAGGISIASSAEVPVRFQLSGTRS